jgi:general secretion pathway protein D
MYRASVVVLVVSIFAGLAGATPAAKPAPNDDAKLAGEDDALYSCKQRTGQVVVSFKSDAEVKDLVAWVMGFTCKNFLLDPRIVATGRKVTIITPNKMSAAEAYRVFLGALATVGLTVVPQGNLLRVVEAIGAHKEALPLMRQGMPDNIDQVVRYVYKPSYIAAEPLRLAWLSLKSEPGDVFTIGSTMVVTDYASHVREMLAFAKLVDVPGGSDGIYTLPVLHADATKLSEKINGILSLTAGAGGAAPAAKPGSTDAPRPDAAAVPSKIIVDERTNTLIVASSEAGYQRVKALVDRLDIALEIEGGSSIHVYPLGSAIAEELAKTLTTAIGDGRAPRPAGAASQTAQTAQTAQTRPGTSPAPPAAVAPEAGPLDGPLGGLGAVLEGQVRVIADPPTNALIVMSSGRDFLAIKDVIRQLDLPRRQVYIEAMILEVDLDSDRTLGAAGHGASSLSGGSGPLLLGGFETGDVNSTALLSTLSSGSGLFAGLISPQTTLLGLNIPSYAALFHALADQTSSHVISTPSIIAVDNVEAKYKVGLTIPVSDGTTFVGAASTTASGTPAGIGNTHITQQELPLTLNIKPHISNNDLVLLEVTHEAKELTSTSSDTLGPSWTTRSFETRVVVRDQQTVVLGGLTQETEQARTTKIPLLGDIPLLGYLFKSETRQKHKTNLLVLLTPYIIKDQQDLQAIRERKLREHDELVRSFSSLDRMKYEPRLDYSRKRGLVEEIHRSLIDVDDDVAARSAIIEARRVTPGSVEPSPAAEPSAPPPAVQ